MYLGFIFHMGWINIHMMLPIPNLASHNLHNDIHINTINTQSTTTTKIPTIYI